MGEMADMYSWGSGWDDFGLDATLAGTPPIHPTKCKYCGEGDVYWGESNKHGWRLHNEDTGEIHKCKRPKVGPRKKK